MRTARLLLATALAAPVLAGCGDAEATGDGLTIATTVYPVQYVAERLAGEHASVLNVTPAGQEPHDLSLTVQKTVELGEADLVVYLSGFQPAVDEVVDSMGPKRAVDAAAVLRSRPDAVPGSQPPRLLEGDPHFWLDPHALLTVARTIRDRLVELAPDEREAIEENWAELETDLVDLDGRASVALDNCQRRTVVVSHDAFAYFGHRYDLDFRAINGLSPDAEPSPAHLRQLQDLITAEGLTTVFSETLSSPQLADTLASDLGLETAVLDPIEGLGEETSAEDYLSLMEANVDALRQANDCTGKPRG